MRIVDMHCDTIERLFRCEKEGRPGSLRENDCHLDLLRMQKSGYLLQNFALFVNSGTCKDPWEEVCDLYACYSREMSANRDLIAPVLCYSDIAENAAKGKLSAMLTVEEGAVCKGEPEKLKALYDMGVRMLTLTWNYPNELGHPNIDSRKDTGDWEAYFFQPNVTEGLTKRGEEFVEAMEEMGMIVDVSHLSDAGFYDVLQATSKPFVASHSNARTVCRASRNLSDDMIRKLGERGGVMGLNFCADFLREVPFGVRNPGAVSDVVLHARHIVNVGGMEVLGLGSDFDGIDTNEGLPGGQSMALLWEALHKAGFTGGQLEQIFEKNVLRVYEETLR